MQKRLNAISPSGFSLLELLMAVAILTTLAAVALFAMSDVVSAGQEAADRRNARQFCETFAAAKAAGVQFSAVTAKGLLEELSTGVRGRGIWAQTEFRLHIALENRYAVLTRCRFDPASATLLLR